MTDSSDFEKNPLLQKFLDASTNGVMVWNKDRVVIYANDAAKGMFGPTAQVGAILPTTASTRVLDKDNGATAVEKLPIVRAFEGEHVHDEHLRVIEADGSHRWLRVSAFPIYDETGQLVYAVSRFRDVSEQYAREAKLRFMIESAKILSLTDDFRTRLKRKAALAVPSLADWAAVDIINEKDEVERIAVINDDPEKVLYLHEFERKYPPYKALPTSLYNSIKRGVPQLIPLITDDMLRAAARSPEHYEDAKRLNLTSIMIIPVVARGRGAGALTLAYAESGRRYTEEDFAFFKEFASLISVLFENGLLFDEIRNRDHAKDLFLASLSHELRNPLAPIKSAIELLKMKSVPTDVREELDVIEHQFDHMARLLNDLLDATRFTQSRISVSKHPSELKKLVERALRSIDALLRNADITLHFTYPSTPIPIMVDETRMEQTITNLMSNAIKFTPAGGSIWVDLQREGEKARISIRDNGAGIAAEDLPNIFDMYYQGSHTRDRQSTGLGIGLLLVKKIIELHDGTVTASSEGKGKGSEFCITIPVTEFPEGDLTPRASTSGPAHKRILVVDDNQQAADSLVKLLNKVGAQADALYSGEEALAHDLSPYEFILLDIGMPRIDGFQLAKALRARGLTIPIIALSGYGMAEDKKKAEESGFSAHLTKPIGLKELNEMFATVDA